MVKNYITIALPFLILIMCSRVEKNFDNELQLLAEAEISFAQLSKDSGIRQAFLTYLTEDAIVLQPKPTNGHDAYKNSPQKPGMLQWKPVFNTISYACDLGYSTGPWEWRPEGHGDTPTLYGHFVSIWKKQENGKWRVVFDGGNSYKKPSIEHSADTLLKQPPASTPDSSTRIKTQNLDEELSRAIAENGYKAALKKVATEQTRFYFSNIEPILGISSLDDSLTFQKNNWTYAPVFSKTSSSDDFSYSYGYIQAGQRSQALSYLHIYRKDNSNQWRLALELALSIPTR
ncbi:MAG: hypothetical protein DWQ10_16810 [Calditrichaeota bacterium]|nr:MAG: hypothetical protein DWQ10_16810 [Calditrichota bacterium]